MKRRIFLPTAVLLAACLLPDVARAQPIFAFTNSLDIMTAHASQVAIGKIAEVDQTQQRDGFGRIAVDFSVDEMLKGRQAERLTVRLNVRLEDLQKLMSAST